MSEPIKPPQPVNAQTPSRAPADEHDRTFEQQRFPITRKHKREERRSGERRAGERRQQERRSKARRCDERRQDGRLSDDRRKSDRRKGERRAEERRVADRRVAKPPESSREDTESIAPKPPGPRRRRGIIDDYA